MTHGNLVLQSCDGNGVTLEPCREYRIAGLPRPCRVVFLAADGVAEPTTRAAYAALAALLARAAGAPGSHCGGPGIWGCVAWTQIGCAQLLIPIIAQRIDAQSRQIMLDWITRSGQRGAILPALLPGVGHGAAFATCPDSLRRLNLLTWLGDPARLGALALRHATGNPRPGVFLSYRRSEAGRVADQIFDGLSQRGWRVFLDRFCGTGGRYFPHELAEQMADKAALVVLETPNIAASTWTMWEIAFAHRYRLGLVGLRWPAAAALARIGRRRDVAPDATGALSTPDLATAVDFIEREIALAALRRRAFHEAMVARAARHGGGAVHPAGDGVLELADRRARPVAAILPSGRPGTLADLPLLANAAQTTRLLVGQHEHLPPAARGDLGWLAGPSTLSGPNGVELCGRVDAYRRVRALV